MSAETVSRPPSIPADTQLRPTGIENCNLGENTIGIKASSQANAVVIRDNNLEGNTFAGIVIGGANQVLVEGKTSSQLVALAVSLTQKASPSRKRD